MAVALILMLTGCGEPTTLFQRLGPEATGVAFQNDLPEDARLNILNYLYYYNGGGVAAGDVDGDGRPDLYFTANRGSNRLYLNRGGLTFADVTEDAGVAGTGDWTTGTTMADVNGDGHLDLYVCVVSGFLDLEGHNQLYLNNGDGTFTEQAAAYGLDFRGYATQAAFFDYDGDGDLDLYLLNHSTHTERTVGDVSLRAERHPRAGDRLYRNDGDTFTDVSTEAGLYGSRIGYGLGIAVSDVDLDGWPDVYVANDFHENDYLYVNNGDGTFTERIAEAMPHTSQFSMGTDAADINNDGRPDLVVLDMLPEDEAVRKTSASAEGFDIYQRKLAAGYHPQFARNTLQLNRGAGRFSDIGYLAGVYATDWSWSALLADYDLDGHTDLYVTNGIYRRPNDLDYINFVSSAQIQMSLEESITDDDLRLIERMPQVPMPNAAFQNRGDLTFAEVGDAWGLADPSFSTGAAYADLDGDGDLDLAVNSINEPAGIYENRTRPATGRHFLTVDLVGDGANTDGIGAKVWAWQGGQQQLRELVPTRGWLSSVEPRVHFGFGGGAAVEETGPPVIDSLLVVWPDRRYQMLTEVVADQHLTLRQADAGGRFDYRRVNPDVQLGAAPRYERITEDLGLDYVHEENVFYDFNREVLIPHKVSTEGPALAVGDVDGDGLDDVYLGASKWRVGALFVQQADGTFQRTNEALWQADSLYEDVDAAFFDADGDANLDLYVVSGGNEFSGEAEALRDRLYLNDGAGGFTHAAGALPDVFANGGTVAPGDVDGDGDLDLFVGGRVVPRAYGRMPVSVLLENDGTGRFRDATADVAPELAEAGMVTDAAWANLDGDAALELVVVGEWMPVRVFDADASGTLAERTQSADLDSTHGWWHSVTPADLDADGDTDLILGNLGRNSLLTASLAEPVRLYVHDFDGDGSTEQILTAYRDGTSYPVASRDELLKRFVPLRKEYPTYTAFGARQIQELFSEEALREADVLEASTFTSAIARNQGDGTFVLEPLPTEAQLAPLFAALPASDGELIVAGNFSGVTPLRGAYDASYGVVLRDEAGRYAAQPLAQSGLLLDGEVRHLAWMRRPGGERMLLVVRNDDQIQVWRQAASPSL